MKQGKYYEREENFTYEERMRISAKSDDRCCHCGKLKYPNYGATIDHFIPLYKGGSNRMINLIMLCEECNKNKGNKIMNLSYIPYLKEEYMEELSNYLDSYINSFEYVARDKLFAFDEYKMLLVNNKYAQALKSLRKSKKTLKPMGIECTMKRADDNDFEKLCDYFEKYLKKYECFESREMVELNINFWLQFGCIYYFEKNHEISTMVAITVKHEESNTVHIDRSICLYVFSYYASDTSFSLACNVVRKFPNMILREQNLSVLPVIIKILSKDKLALDVLHSVAVQPTYFVNAVNFYELPLNIFREDIVHCEDITEKDIQKTNEFFKQFNDVEKKLIRFVQKESDSGWIGWMLYDILSSEDIERYQLFANDPVMQDYNNQILAIKQEENNE